MTTLTPIAERSADGFPVFDREQCRADLSLSSVYGLGLDRRVESYFQNMRLFSDAEGAGYQDCDGGTFRVPAETVLLETLNLHGRDYQTFLKGSQDVSKWLVFRDAGGSVVLVLPDYGWDWDTQLKPWAVECGWRTDLSLREVEAGWRSLGHSHPGLTTAPIVLVGKAMQQGAKRKWVQ